MRKIAGFTLVEILVVVAIIVLLAGAGGGIYLGSYKKRLVSRSAQELLRTAKYARVVAIERNQPCKMNFDREKNRYWLTMKVLEQDSGQMEDSIIDNRYSKPVELLDELKLEEIIIRPVESESGQEYEYTAGVGLDSKEIVFSPDGTANAAMVTVGDGKRRYTLTISGATAKAKLTFGLPDETTHEIIDLDRT